MSHKSWYIYAVTAFILAALAPAASAATGDDYANQTLYGNPKDTDVRKPPDGYSLIFVETIGRHGARSLTSDNTEQAVLDVWNAANKKNALTDTGKNLSRDVKKFQEAERKIGYGKLNDDIGKDEMKGIGRRTGDNYKSFFSSVAKKNEKIATVTSDITRTKQSASSLRGGLKAGVGSAIEKILAPPSEAPDLLRISNDATSAGKDMTNKILARSYVRDHAKHLLAASYKKSYVDSLSNPVGAALDLDLLFATAPGLKQETDVTFSKYVPQEDREAMSFATDARTFYKYGPGVKGESSTFKDARPLLKDFFDRLDKRIDGGSTAAVFRVGHGETTMPFAALIKAPRSEQQTAKGEMFSRKTNPWGGAWPASSAATSSGPRSATSTRASS